jgi:hypothetical protein
MKNSNNIIEITKILINNQANKAIVARPAKSRISDFQLNKTNIFQ